MLEIEILSERIDELEAEVSTLKCQLALRSKAKSVVEESTRNLYFIAFTGAFFLLFVLGFSYESDRVRYNNESTLNLLVAVLTSGTGIYALGNYRDRTKTNQSTIDETQSYFEAVR